MVSEWIFSLSQAERNFYAFLLFGIIIVTPVLLYLFRTFMAHGLLYIYFWRRLEKNKTTPKDLRHALAETANPLWRVSYLTKRKFGSDTEKNRLHYLKRFTYLHFRRSSRWKSTAVVESATPANA